MRALFFILCVSATLRCNCSAQDLFDPGFVGELTPAAVGGGSETAFVASFTPGTPRANFSADLGFKITVGAADVVVTKLGRWVIAGNSQSHTLKIWNSSCTTVASVSVNTSGASSGAFLYGTLASPYTLSAGGVYYISSSEVSGQDEWFNNDANATYSAVATINGSFYESAGCNVNFDPDHMYVGLDFKYSSP